MISPLLQTTNVYPSYFYGTVFYIYTCQNRYKDPLVIFNNHSVTDSKPPLTSFNYICRQLVGQITNILTIVACRSLYILQYPVHHPQISPVQVHDHCKPYEIKVVLYMHLATSQPSNHFTTTLQQCPCIV